MKQTAIQQAITMVRNRIEAMSLYDNVINYHNIYHLQKVERELYELLETEKEQMMQVNKKRILLDYEFEQYYNETYGNERNKHNS
jgi:hypothetical protein